MGRGDPRLSGHRRVRGRCALKHDRPDPLDTVAWIDRATAKLGQLEDPDLVEIAARFGAWLSGDAGSLDEALGVGRAPCQRDVRTIWSLHRRNEAVRRAYAEWGNADALARDLARYQAAGWSRDRLEKTCPERLRYRRERFLWEILLHRDHALSRTQIYEIVRNAP